MRKELWATSEINKNVVGRSFIRKTATNKIPLAYVRKIISRYMVLREFHKCVEQQLLLLCCTRKAFEILSTFPGTFSFESNHRVGTGKPKGGTFLHFSRIQRKLLLYSLQSRLCY